MVRGGRKYAFNLPKIRFHLTFFYQFCPPTISHNTPKIPRTGSVYYHRIHILSNPPAAIVPWIDQPSMRRRVMRLFHRTTRREGEWAPGGGASVHGQGRLGRPAGWQRLSRSTDGGPWQRIGPWSSGGRVSCGGERRSAQCVGGIQGRRLVVREEEARPWAPAGIRGGQRQENGAGARGAGAGSPVLGKVGVSGVERDVTGPARRRE
jgi:hypothetical protein